MTRRPQSGPGPELEFTGSFDDYWSYTKVRDWILLLPDIGRTALHLYLVLRSMLSEKRSHSLRRMSVDQLCWLLPGINGKPIGKRTVEEALRELDRLGLVTNPDHERLVTSTGKSGITNSLRRYQVNDLPPSDFTGWRNSWDKLDAYRPDWRQSPPPPPTHATPCRPDAQKSADRSDVADRHGDDDLIGPHISARAPRKAAGRAQKSATRAPKAASGRSMTSTDGLPQEATQESFSPPVTAQAVAAAWAEGVAAAGLGALPRRRADIQAQAEELLSSGHGLARLIVVAAWMGATKPGWHRLESALTYQGPDAALPLASLTTGEGSPGCAHCDAGWCYEDPDNALRPYRCPHCRHGPS